LKDTIYQTRELLSSILSFILAIKSVGSEIEQPMLLTTVAQKVQASIVELAGFLKKAELGIAECDAAMNLIASILGYLDNPQPNNALTLAKAQEATNNATKKLISTLSALNKAQKTSPDTALGESSKALGEAVGEMVKNTTGAIHFIVQHGMLGQNLLFNTKEVSIAVGNYLQFSKNVAINPKDAAAQQQLQNGFQAVTQCLGRLVAVQKEFMAIK
jgi:hypothetical protein